MTTQALIAAGSTPRRPAATSLWQKLQFGAVFGGFPALLWAEQDWASLPFLAAVTLGLIGLAYALSRRPLASAQAGVALIALVTVVSAAKYRFTAVNATTYDLVFYFRDTSTIEFLLGEFAAPVSGVAALILLAGAWLTAAFISERPSATPRKVGLVASLACFGATVVTLPAASGSVTYYTGRSHFASSVLGSAPDLIRMLHPSPLADRVAAQEPGAPYPAWTCSVDASAPDVVMVLSESTVMPAQIPEWGWAAGQDAVDRSFRSFDGRAHRARVETFAGATWVSEAQVLSGMSMADLGWMRPYAARFMQGATTNALPARLKACGYRTIAVSPLKYKNYDEGPLLSSLGFDEVLDSVAIGAPTTQEPDSFYYAAALRVMRERRAAGGGPLFVFVMTMEAHAPYDFAFPGSAAAPVRAVTEDPSVLEYLRRVASSRAEFRAFADAVRQDTRGRGAVLINFGDHQPIVTLNHLPIEQRTALLNDFGSPAYETYYAVELLNLEPKRPLPAYPILDLGYVPMVALDAAGIALDPTQLELRELMESCEGRFHTCADRTAVDRRLRRLTDAGMLRLP